METRPFFVSVSQVQDGIRKILIPAPDGYLGTWNKESEFELAFSGNQKTSLFVRQVRDDVTDMFSKIVPIQPVYNPLGNGGDSAGYVSTVKTIRIGNGEFVAKYPRNSVKTLIVTGNDGGTHQLDIWETGVLSQGNDQFLTSQLVYSSELFNKDGYPFAPSYEALSTWTDLRFQLVLFLQRNFIFLTDFTRTDTAEKPEVKLPKGKNCDVVLWFTEASGLGVIETVRDNEKVTARVYWKNIVAEPSKKRRYLAAGEIISFAKLEPVSDQRSSIRFEAKAVKPVSIRSVR